jgi:GntR family transcriptional regulator, arabinose operon transcriptional repressor
MNNRAHFNLGSRSAFVLQKLRDLLNSGKLGPDGRLPREEDLCRTYGVSRSTVRRAVACLVEEGLIMVRKRAGMFALQPPGNSSPASSNATIAIMGALEAAEMAGLQETAIDRNHLLSFYSQNEARWDSRRERKFLEQVRRSRHRGLVAFLSPLEPRNEGYVTKLAEGGLRIVHLEYPGLRVPRESYCLCDYKAAGRIAAENLLRGKYSHIALIRATDAPYEQLMEEGFAAALRKEGHHFMIKRNRIDSRRLKRDDSMEGRIRLLARLQDHQGSLGVFCLNHFMLMDVLRFAKEAGRRIPDDLGIVTFQCGTQPSLKKIDSIMYDRLADYQRALQSILAPRWRVTQHLQAPTLVRQGSVRAASPA